MEKHLNCIIKTLVVMILIIIIVVIYLGYFPLENYVPKSTPEHIQKTSIIWNDVEESIPKSGDTISVEIHWLNDVDVLFSEIK
jgi:hypothetical protein